MTDRPELHALNALLAPRYTILSELGRGGMAIVYLAEDRKHQRRVAVKVLRPELTQVLGPERFLREIRIAAGLNHPHIVPVHDSGEVAGTFFYVMPLVEGESLRTRLDREGPLPVSAAVELGRQVAGALDHAHAQQIIHRDLKPENILLAGSHALVADFGVARAIAEAGGERLTETGLAIGTPYYMSPEQAAADPRMDARSDVYSLGIVLYEALTGDVPFRSMNARAALARKLADEIPPIRTVRESVPPAVENAVMRALARNPADRFPTAGAFAEALEQAWAMGTVRATTPFQWMSGDRRRSHLLVGMAMAGLLLVIGWLSQRGLGASAGDSLPGIRSLAVLPLQNRSGDAEQEYFVDGMTDGLISELGRIRALQVTSRTSAMRYRDTDKSVPEIAQELGVAALLEGSLMSVADSVRLILTLIDGATDRQIWSASYQEDLRNVVTLQRRVAREIAGATGAELTARERERLVTARPVNPEALRLSLVGDHHLGSNAHQQALAAYERAIAIDSTHAPAYAGAALVYTQMGNWWGVLPPDSAYALARRAAERAIALDSTNADAHAALATVNYLYDWDWERAEIEFRRGMELNPTNLVARIEYANFLTSMGSFEESAALGRRTLALDPTLPGSYNELAFALDLGQEDAEALRTYRASLDVDSSYEQTQIGLMIYFSRRAQADSALKYLRKLERMIDLSSPSNIALAAEAYANINMLDEARRLAERLDRDSDRIFVAPGRLAVVYACLGRNEEAFAAMERAYEARDPSLVWYSVDVHACLNPLRPDPRFENLMQRLSFPGG